MQNALHSPVPEQGTSTLNLEDLNLEDLESRNSVQSQRDATWSSECFPQTKHNRFQKAIGQIA